ncbi:MAG: ABC transporter permease [Bacteroidales bacterium]|nr:ABC transporter permease [Bacteroidales bacterium]
MIKNLIIENIRISLESIRSHKVRAILTVLIIAFGIMALVGILTSIDSIKNSLNENFAMMGSNTFTIRNREIRVHMGGTSNRPKNFRNINYDEAMTFKDRFTFPATVSSYTWGTGIATLKYKSEKTNPNIQVLGVDNEYLATAGLEMGKGRNFNHNEIYYGAHVAIIGNEIKTKLFDEKEDPVGKTISIGSGKYLVIGVLKEKGSSVGFSGDRRCLVPVNNVRQYFGRPNMNFSINVMTNNSEDIESAIDEATGVLRIIRKDPLGEDNSFGITKSDTIANMLIDLIKYVTLAATLIGFITLLGAAIGLMNIMLVSVTERTKEIGIRKATGATNRSIRNQFLVEAIVIAQMGGVLGIILGIAVGNIVSMVSGTAFIVPWMWILLGVVLCLIVALASGILPATKAAKLDPIESLRYE